VPALGRVEIFFVAPFYSHSLAPLFSGPGISLQLAGQTRGRVLVARIVVPVKAPTKVPETLPGADSALKDLNSRSIAARPRGGRGTSRRAKEQFLRILQEGLTVEEAMRHVGRVRTTYEYWRKTDPKLREQADHIIGLRRRSKEDGGRKPVPDFPEFCETYLGFRLFWHQLQWVDLIEGREPRDLHPAQKYLEGPDGHLLLVNVPPNFAKSTTITAGYTLWRLMKDPNTQIVIVSKNLDMAKKWMFQIQDWLTNPTYKDLHFDFGPEGGFEKSSPIWNKTQIYFGNELRVNAEKDPTLEVLGMGGTIYGARADLIILDDIVDTSNAHEFDKQIEWITGMVLTRPADEDKVLVIGTRVSPVDLYKELLNPQRYEDEEPPWTYFSSPAVLEFADEPRDWVTLWPKSNVPKRNQIARPDAEGLFTKWDGPSLARMRKRVSTDPYTWSLKYQQEDVSLDTVFRREDVYGCVDPMRHAGPLIAGAPGHPASGMQGLYVIGGFDPASEGFTAATVVALDRGTKRRYVLGVNNQANMQPHQVRDLIISWTKQYGIREWRVEKVLLSSWITQDKKITQDLANLGCSILPHQTTGGTKWDADAGVMAMSGLFRGWAQGENLIFLPSPRGNEHVRALCEQLTNYFPKTKGKTDTLMALWFADVRCRELVLDADEDYFLDSEYTSERGLGSRSVIDFAAADIDGDDFELSRWWS